MSADVDHVVIVGLAAAVFVVVFLRTQIGLYLLVLAMLFSPEYPLGSEGLAEARVLTLRVDDLLLLVIGFAWLTKTALNKELGLVLRTPLNRPILAYLLSVLVATLLGYVTGTIQTAAGYFYVLKYTEYFAVYYMVANNLRHRRDAWRLVMVMLAVAAVVSVISIAQIPSGGRVTAPFEGDPEPNTLGGYLLLMMALAAGLALQCPRPAIRWGAVALLGTMVAPFLFTLSRGSYLGAFPAFAVLVITVRRRLLAGTLVVGAAILLLLIPPLLTTVLPPAVVERVLGTFEPAADNPRVTVAEVDLDPSTSQRIISNQAAFEAWQRRPLLGYGVTGFRFLDAQYARTLVETGLVGMAAFLWLLVAVIRRGIVMFRTAGSAAERGLALGFLAGTAGLLGHALAANTFIIVRIMEPFWLLTAIVVTLPTLPDAAEQ